MKSNGGVKVLLVAAGAVTVGYFGRGIVAPTSVPEPVVEQPATQLMKVGSDALPSIGPVTPGLLQPFSGAKSGTGVQPVMVGPQGKQRQPSQAVVVFDRPMVALTDLDAQVELAPLECGPDIDGVARWAGTSTAVWVPTAGRFPEAHSVQCSIPEGLTALDGAAVTSAIDFRFSTERPKVVSAWPRSNSNVLHPDHAIYVEFNQPVDPAAVARNAVLRPANGGAPVALVGSRPEGNEAYIPNWIRGNDDTHAVLLSGPIAKHTPYVLSIDNVKGAVGPLPMNVAHTMALATIPPAGVKDYGPGGGDVEPYAHLSIEFTTQVEAAEVAKRLRIEPAPPDGFNPPTEGKSRYWSHGLRLKPMTTYTMTLASGLTDIHGQVLAEGDYPSTWRFTTGHLSPLLDVAVGPNLFPANNPDTLPIRSRNLTDLYAAVEPVDPAWVAANLARSYRWSTGKNTRKTQAQPVDYSAEVGVTDAVRIHEIDLSAGLNPANGEAPRTGMMMIETWSSQVRDYWEEEKVLMHRTVLQKTNLGTTLKLGPHSASVWVTQLSDGTAVSDAAVELFRGGELKWSGSTDATGMVLAPDVVPVDWNAYKDPIAVMVTKGSDAAITVSGSPNELGTWESGVYASTPGRDGEVRVHAYTDRGVYRRGEVAHVALTARVADKDGLTVADAADASWACTDYADAPMLSGEGRLDRHGAVSFDVEISTGAALGNGACTITLKHEGYTATRTVLIPVKAYRAPTFRVDVSTPDAMVAGDVLDGTGVGRYLFGAPMTGMDARWTAFSTVTDPQPEGWDEFAFGALPSGNWWEEEYRSQERIASGEGLLDSKGELPWSFDVPVTENPETRTVMVEVQVTDVSRQALANRSEVLVHPADVYAGLRFADGIGVAETPTTVEFVTVTPEGESVDGVAVDFTVVRRTWDSIRQKDMDGMWAWVNTINDVEVTTEQRRSSRDAASFEWTPPEGGYYVVKASVRDDQGRTSVTERALYVTGAGATWARSDGNHLSLVPDKRRYTPGETATILVKAPRPGLSALVTVEREGVLSREVVTLESTADTIEIPITEDAVPNLFVSVVAVEGAPPSDSPEGTIPNWYMGYVPLEVDPNGRRLAVDVKTDSSTYQPGQTVKATVSVSRGDEAVGDAHVVLYAVDYGVLSLTNYGTPDAFSTYYAKHPLRVKTADNRTRVLNRGAFLAKGGDVGGGGGDGGSGTRSRFVTTPLWMPNLTTGKNGSVEVEFELPDNLTTFKLMAVVDSGADGYGSGSNELKVAKPLMAQPALPRLLRVGDSAFAGIVLHNNRDEARTVEVTAEATNVTIGDPMVSVRVAANSAKEVAFSLTDPQPGDAVFRFEATAGTDRDAVEVTLSVERPQPVEFVASMGSTTSTAQEAISLSSVMIPGVGGLHVQASPTVLVGADASLRYMMDYPYECLEQTSSRLIAGVLASELGDAASLEASEASIQRVVTTNLARLGDFAHPSGGYSFWPAAYSGPHALGSAYAMEARAMAGQMPKPETIHFLRGFLGGKWMPRWWSEAQAREAQVRVALALARVGVGDGGFNSALFGVHADLSPTAQAELLEAMVLTSGRNDGRLGRLASRIQGQMHVEASTAVVHDEQSRFWNGRMAATAATLSAFMAFDPDHAMVDRLAKGLMHGRSQGRWSNTYTTAKALVALRDYTAVHERADGTASVAVQLNGSPLLEQALKRAPARAFVPLDELRDGTLDITSTGGTVHYETRLEYAAAEMPPRDQGFTVIRTYRMLEGADGDNSGVTPGALVRVSLRVVTPVDRTDVVVHDPLPAGLEPVDTSFNTSATMVTEDGSRSSGLGSRSVRNSLYEDSEAMDDIGWSSWVFNHRVLDDASVSLFADVMPAGVHTYSYVARATTPGVYAKPAAYAQEMYRPEVYGRTEQGEFVVGNPLIAMDTQ